MRILPLSLSLLISCSFLFACSKEEGDLSPIDKPRSVITVTKPHIGQVEITEETVGSLESLTSPLLCAEIFGKIEKILVSPGESIKKGQVLAIIEGRDLSLTQQEAQSDVKRLEVLLNNQQQTTKRYQELLKEKYVSQSMLDEAIAQTAALQEQYQGAKARLALTERNITKRKIIAPMDARVEKQFASKGSFVRTGDPLFQIVTTNVLRAKLPFPESVAPLLKPHLKVRLSSPTSPHDILETSIREIKPMVSLSNHSLEAILELENHGEWKPGSSVNAQIIIATRNNALLVPEHSIVLRPVGSVVYVIKNNLATQQIIQTGVSQNGMVEILSGLSENDTIAVDGAGFLTDKTPISIHKG